MTKQKLKLYYVEGGDTLYKIANRFNTTEQEIRKFNKPWLSRLSSGLKLWVPDNRIGTETSSVVDDIEIEDRIQRKDANLRVKAADIESIEISPKKIIYKENSPPGYVVIKLKTIVPTIGEVTVTGSSTIEKITLSEAAFKTEHLILWNPINSRTKQPMPPGEYTLNFNLFKNK
jgi:LysM repeat protein